MKYFYSKFLLCILITAGSLSKANAQAVACPTVNAGPDVNLSCGNNCTTLHAAYTNVGSTTSYSVSPIGYAPITTFNAGTPIIIGIDDRWSLLLPLPFPFCFFGTTYNNVVVGSNGIISFNAAYASPSLPPSSFCQWSLTALGTIPSLNFPVNSIMGPYQDIDPSYQGQISWEVIDAAPCRKFVCNFYQVPYFGDPNSVSTAWCGSPLYATSQIVLYETTNVIDIYINSKPDCPAWNGGLAIEGIQNATGTVAFAVPGRNNSVFTAFNDAYRFTPNDLPWQVSLAWFDPLGNFISSADSITVCPGTASTYTLNAHYGNCPTATTVDVSDQVTVTPSGTLQSTLQSQQNVSCFGGNNGAASVVINVGSPPYTYNWTPVGGNGATASNLTAGTYTCSITNPSGCLNIIPVTITQPPVLTNNNSPTNILCYSGNTGQIIATPGGGTPGYTYQWSPAGGNGQTASSLAAGAYTVTVTDSHGCTITSTSTITQPTQLTAAGGTLANVSCFNGNNGSVAVTPGGGTGPYTYQWAPSGGTGQTASSLSASPSPFTYTVTVTDQNGCSVTSTATITQPNVLTALGGTLANVSCNGGNNGVVRVNPNGGSPGYTYTWSPAGGNGQTASNLTAGTYTVTVTDSHGCTVSSTANVVQPSALAAPTSTLTNVSCNGGNNGSASVTPNGGTGTYTYQWSPVGGTGQTASNLAAGTYTITVTDANGCTITSTATVTQPTALTAIGSNVTNVLCNSGNNGSVTVTPNNGTPNYTYLWSPSAQATQTAINLGVGTYTVTVTDANGCTITATASVTQPSALAAVGSTLTNVTCNGGNNGSVSVAPSNGSPAYTYQWSPAGGNGQTASNLIAGIYTVTVTDANGCSITSTSTVTEPTPLAAASSTLTNVLCTGGTDGSVTVTPNNGSPSYTYLWSPSGGNGQTASSLGMGTYTVLVTDANGCTVTTTATVTEPPLLAAISSTVTNVACNAGSDGSATVTPGGGTGAYTYSWLPSGGMGQTASNLTAGTYTVVVADANGCLTSTMTTITEPTALTAVGSTLANVLCNSGNDGVVTVTPGNGSPGYSYQWSPAGGNGQTASNLALGSYTVTVTDANGCTITATADVTQPSALAAASSTLTNVLCAGSNEGSATVNPSNGSPAYTYQWSPAGGNGQTANGLTAGIYTVTVSDANGCSVTATTTITEPVVLTAAGSTLTNISCNGGSDGSVNVTPSDGTPGYTYLWSPSGSTDVSATGLAIGTYTVLVTDANGCTTTATATVTEPPLLTALGYTVTNVSCNSGSDGSATVTPGGGTGAYTYSWLPSGGMGQSATGLTAGTYTVVVADANGCLTSSMTTITEPTPLNANASTLVNIACSNSAAGVVSASGNGGTGTYTYLWSPSGGTDATASSLTGGTYTVTITDANGCTQTATTLVGQTNPVQISVPTTTNVACNGGSDGQAISSVTGGAGPYAYSWSPSGGTDATATGLPQGSYTVTVTDANGCTEIAYTAITEPALLTSSIPTSTNVLCAGGTNGSAIASANGGTGAYSYVWSPVGGTDATATGLAQGSYTVTVTDANGCNTTSMVTITEPALLTSGIGISSNLTCNANNSGVASVDVLGGTGAYTYSWLPSGGNGATASNLAAGTYTVAVADANGCITASTTTLTEPAAMSSVINASANITCFGGNDGMASVLGGGGSIPYAYTWSSGGTNSVENNLAAGSYTVTVTDINGCSTSTNVTLTQPTQVTAAISAATDANCNGQTNGSATVLPGGGVGSYNYQWSSGGNAATENNLGAGTYTVTVTDGNNCTATTTVTINEPNPLLANIPPATDVSCNGGNNGSAVVNVNGGTGPYTYSWLPSGGTDAVASGLTAGTYTVGVADAHGCLTAAFVTINEPLALSAPAGTTTDVTCFGGSNGSAWVNPTGGTAPYNYLWSPSNGTDQFPSGLPAGNFSVTVTDAHGCTFMNTTVITQPTALTLSINGAATICQQQSATITAVPGGGTGPYAYLWDSGPNPTDSTQTVSPTSTTPYNVTVTDAYGCTISQSVTITVNPPLAVNAQSTPQICEGSPANVSVMSSSGGNGGPYTYSWSTGQTAASFNTNPGITTTYTVTISDGCSPDTFAMTTVIVNPMPIVSFGPAASSGCAPVSVDFTDSTIVTPGATYSWSLGDGTTSNQQSPSYTFTNPGAYNVVLTVTSAENCTSVSAPHPIIVYPVPDANFIAPDTWEIVDGAMPFPTNNLSTNSDSWYWDFGDGHTDSVFSPYHSYADTGLYTIMLISTNSEGCIDTAYRTIYVSGEFVIYIPDAFTPNGDGTNDGFNALGVYVKDFDMWIFDRWGGKIYHSTSLKDPWNGTYFNNGNLCQNGVYVYRIKAHDYQGKLHEFVGSVTLVR